MRTTSLNIGGLRLAVRHSAGQGPAAVLVHGNSLSSEAFNRQLDGRLGAEFRLVALDLPGHGLSARADRPTSVYSLPGFAAIVCAAAEALELCDAAFVGWSLGGHVVLEAAPRLTRAAGFCVFGTPPLTSPPNFDRAFLPTPATDLIFKESVTDSEFTTWASLLALNESALPPSIVREMRRADPRMRSSMLNSMGTIGFADETVVVETLRQPIAILQGTHDAFVNAEYIRSLKIPFLWRGDVQPIHNAGHAPQWDAPDAFDALLGAFLRDTAKRDSETLR